MTPEQLTSAMLDVLGVNITCMNTARRHGRALDAILQFDIPAYQRAALEERREAILARWGGWWDPPGTPLKIKPMSLPVWLSKRQQGERVFYSLKGAAKALVNGERSLTRLMVEAYCASGQGLVCPVSLNTFRLWLLRTGVAAHAARGEYVPGPNAERLLQLHWRDIADEVDAAIG